MHSGAHRKGMTQSELDPRSLMLSLWNLLHKMAKSLMGWIVALQNSHVEALIPRSSEYFNYFRAFKEVIRLKEAVRVSPGLLRWHSDKNLPAPVRDTVLMPGAGISPRAGNGNLFQYTWLENFMNRGAWWATVHGVAKSWTQLSDRAHTHTHTHTEWALMQSDWCPYKKRKFRQIRGGIGVLAHRGTIMWRYSQMQAKEKCLRRNRCLNVRAKTIKSL